MTETSLSDNPDYCIVGRIGAPHGVRGWARLISFTEPHTNILNYTPWLMERNGEWQPIKLLAHKTQPKVLLVQLDGYTNRDEIALLTHTTIAVERSALGETGDPDSFYWHDLQGCEVITQKETQSLGHVDHLITAGDNDVLVVTGDRERLIPFLQHQVIQSVDLTAKKIIVDWDPEF